jgi:hypothetical protein
MCTHIVGPGNVTSGETRLFRARRVSHSYSHLRPVGARLSPVAETLPLEERVAAAVNERWPLAFDGTSDARRNLTFVPAYLADRTTSRSSATT